MKGTYDVPMTQSEKKHSLSTTSEKSTEIPEKKFDFDTPHLNHHGFHWLVCAVLIVGDMAGGGLVALPSSFVNSGLWAGIAMTIISAFLSAYTGIQLGDNWIIMQNRWSEYRESCRKPYPEMGYRAFGRGGRIFVSIIITIQQFGLSVVFLLLASNNISSFLFAFWQFKVNFCFIALAVAAFILPFLMLGSAKDFWQAGFVAMISTTIAVCFIVTGAIHDWGACVPDADYPSIVFNKFFLSYGTIMFAYGGHSVFPSFQHDMKKPNDFGKSVVLGYIIILIMYLPVSILGYIVYGGSQGSSIITSLQISWIQQTVNVLITVHVVFTQIIICSPLTLQFEEIFHVPNKFGIRRVIVRTVIVLCVLFVALSIPNFGAILDLIGGTTITMLTMLLPAIFNMYLVASTKKRELFLKEGIIRKDEEDSVRASISEVFRYNHWGIIILNVIILVFGAVGGVASTISAVVELIDNDWQLPCYISVFQGSSDSVGSEGAVSCCGHWKNITTVDGMDPLSYCAVYN